MNQSLIATSHRSAAGNSVYPNLLCALGGLMQFRSSMVIFLLAIAFLPATSFSEEASNLKPEHAKVVRNWLHGKSYRLAERADNKNESCIPSQQLYYLEGDLTNDKVEDFVVIVVDNSNPDNALLLVFNGPFKSRNYKVEPSLAEPIFEYRRGGLGTEEGMGVFSFCICDTDNCGTFKWNGKQYEAPNYEEDDGGA